MRPIGKIARENSLAYFSQEWAAEPPIVAFQKTRLAALSRSHVSRLSRLDASRSNFLETRYSGKYSIDEIISREDSKSVA